MNKTAIIFIFCPIDLPKIGNPNAAFQMIFNPVKNYLDGTLPNTDRAFGYVAESGVFWDDERVLFYAQAIFPSHRTFNFFPKLNPSMSPTGFNLKGDFNRMSFLAQDIELTGIDIIETEIEQSVKVLDISARGGLDLSQEGIITLGITQDEFAQLKNVNGLSGKHRQYIFLEDVSPTPAVDIGGKAYKKYKLCVQGLDNNGNKAIVSPVSDIYVYTTREFVFASKDFAEKEKTTKDGCGCDSMLPLSFTDPYFAEIANKLNAIIPQICKIFLEKGIQLWMYNIRVGEDGRPASARITDDGYIELYQAFLQWEIYDQASIIFHETIHLGQKRPSLERYHLSEPVILELPQFVKEHLRNEILRDEALFPTGLCIEIQLEEAIRLAKTVTSLARDPQFHRNEIEALEAEIAKFPNVSERFRVHRKHLLWRSRELLRIAESLQ